MLHDHNAKKTSRNKLLLCKPVRPLAFSPFPLCFALLSRAQHFLCLLLSLSSQSYAKSPFLGHELVYVCVSVCAGSLIRHSNTTVCGVLHHTLCVCVCVCVCSGCFHTLTSRVRSEEHTSE